MLVSALDYRIPLLIVMTGMIAAAYLWRGRLPTRPPAPAAEVIPG